jgi:flagellar biosynthetic protein FliR
MVGESLGPFLVAFARIAPIVALHPVFGGRTVPRPVAAGLAAALALSASAGGQVSLTGVPLVAALAREVVAGTAIGLVGVAVFGAIEAAGRLVDDARGAGFAALYDPLVEAPTSPIGQLDLHAAVALFWSLGLHAGLFSAIAADVELAGAGAPALERAAALAGTLARAGLALGGPAAASCVAVDLLVGFAARSAPNASLLPIGLTVKLLAALLVTALAMPERARVWGELWVEHLRWIGAA